MKKLLAETLNYVRESLAPLGYWLVKSQQGFFRSAAGRTEMFVMSTVSHPQRYRVIPAVCVRFNEIENIFHRTSGWLPEAQKCTATVGVALNNVFGPEEIEVPILGLADVPHAASRIVSIFHERAVPYFRRFVDLAAVDAAINATPNERCIFQTAPWLRASKGVIVAKLLGRSDYASIAKVYREMMLADSDGYYLANFDALLADLESYPDRAGSRA